MGSHTLSNTARARLSISGIPRSASVIANGHRGNAGHAIAVILRVSTCLGSCPQLLLSIMKYRLVKYGHQAMRRQNEMIQSECHHIKIKSGSRVNRNDL